MPAWLDNLLRPLRGPRRLVSDAAALYRIPVLLVHFLPVSDGAIDLRISAETRAPLDLICRTGGRSLATMIGRWKRASD